LDDGLAFGRQDEHCRKRTYAVVAEQLSILFLQGRRLWGPTRIVEFKQHESRCGPSLKLSRLNDFLMEPHAGLAEIAAGEEGEYELATGCSLSKSLFVIIGPTGSGWLIAQGQVHPTRLVARGSRWQRLVPIAGVRFGSSVELRV
jgi:hypothetical protein